MKIDKCEKLVCICVLNINKHKHKTSKAGTESWANNTRKSPQSNPVQSGIKAKPIHKHEHRTQNKSQK